MARSLSAEKRTVALEPHDRWTIGRLLIARLERAPDDVAVMQHIGGSRARAYRPVAWRELARLIDSAVASLDLLGVCRGDCVAIISGPRLEYLVLEYAVYVRGAIAVGVYPTCSVTTLEHTLADSEAVVCAAESQDDIARIEALMHSGRLPAARHITPIGQWIGGPRAESEPSLRGVRSKGYGVSQRLEEVARQVNPDDVACLIYTSGTTGPPKGVVHTHRTFLHAVAASAPLPRGQRERMLWHLPASHVVGKVRVFGFPLVHDTVVWIADPQAPFIDSMRDARPTYLTAPPRFYEKAVSAGEDLVRRLPLFHRCCYRPAMRAAGALVDELWARRRPPWHLVVAAAIGRRFIFHRLLRGVGFDCLHTASTGSAPVPPEMVRTLHAWGLDLRVTYGLTETGGRVITHHRPFSDPRNLGEQVQYPGLELRIAPDGELLARGPCICTRYWKDEQSTRESLPDGCLRTGDLVRFDPDTGSFRLIGRKKDIINTSGGKSISPAVIEEALTAQPSIARAVVIGDGRKFLTALIEPATGVAGAHQLDSLLILSEQIAADIAAANRELGRVEQIKRFRILPRPLKEIDDAAVTPTGKVRRHIVERTCAALVEDMYGEHLTAAGLDPGTPSAVASS